MKSLIFHKFGLKNEIDVTIIGDTVALSLVFTYKG